MNNNQKTGTETRERILIEASRLFAEQSYHGTTTREIAAAVGISQPSLFFHFETKKAILEELCRLDLVPAVSRMENLVVASGSPAGKLFATVVGEVRVILGWPYDLRAHLSFEVLNDPDLAVYRELSDRFDHMVHLLIRAGQEEGEFLPVDPALAHHLVTGILLRASLFEGDVVGDSEEVAVESAALVLRSLLADPGRLDEVRREAAELARFYTAG